MIVDGQRVEWMDDGEAASSRILKESAYWVYHGL